jgi:hypothetical protein|tara:strand:+ start:5223 stop:5465 length:243 start_codon:yes stop_codon:yes gene_type:complete
MTDMFEPSSKELQVLVELAMDNEITDPIDWSELNISEKEAYIMMASHVMEMDDNPTVNKSIIVKLMVENFVLNLKLLGKK